MPILGRDRGCHPNPPLCHHVPDRPQRRVAGARPVAVAANEPGCLRISLLVCRLPFLSWLWRRSGRPTASRNTHPGWTSESTEAHEGGIRPTINAGPMADGASRMIDGAAVHVSSAQRGSRIGGEDAAHSPPPSNEKVLDGSPGYHYEDIQPFGRCFQLRLDGTPESRCAGRTGEAAVITGEGTQSASSGPHPPDHLYIHKQPHEYWTRQRILSCLLCCAGHWRTEPCALLSQQPPHPAQSAVELSGCLMLRSRVRLKSLVAPHWPGDLRLATRQAVEARSLDRPMLPPPSMQDWGCPASRICPPHHAAARNPISSR